MADLISYEDKLKAISHSTKCSEGWGFLIPYKKEFDGNIIISLNIMVRGVPDLILMRIL